MAKNTAGAATALKEIVAVDHLQKAEDDFNAAATLRTTTLRELGAFNERVESLKVRFERTGEAFTFDREKHQKLVGAANDAVAAKAAAGKVRARAKDDARGVGV